MKETKEVYYCDICKKLMTDSEVEDSRTGMGSYKIGYIIPIVKAFEYGSHLANGNYYDICPECRLEIARTVSKLSKSFEEVHNREYESES